MSSWGRNAAPSLPNQAPERPLAKGCTATSEAQHLLKTQVVPRPRSPTPEPESPPTHPIRKRHKGASAAAVDRARKLREELDEGSPRLAAPTYAPGNGTPFRPPGPNGHANGANGFSESDLALL